MLRNIMSLTHCHLQGLVVKCSSVILVFREPSVPRSFLCVFKIVVLCVSDASFLQLSASDVAVTLKFDSEGGGADRSAT